MTDGSVTECLTKGDLDGSDYVRLLTWVNARAAQCAALAASGEGRVAILTAEAAPSLETLMEALQQTDAEEWEARCLAAGITNVPTLQEEPLAILEALSEVILPPDHPLYRQYRAAMVNQDSRAALLALRKMANLAPCDPNVVEELIRMEAQLKEPPPGAASLPPFPKKPEVVTAFRSAVNEKTSLATGELDEEPNRAQITEPGVPESPRVRSRSWLVGIAAAVMVVGLGSVAVFSNFEKEGEADNTERQTDIPESLASDLKLQGYKQITHDELRTIAATNPQRATEIASFAVQLAQLAGAGDLDKFVKSKINTNWIEDGAELPSEIKELYSIVTALETLHENTMLAGTISMAWRSYTGPDPSYVSMRRILGKYPKLRSGIETKLVEGIQGNIQPKNTTPTELGGWSSWLGDADASAKLRALSAHWSAIEDAKSTSALPEATTPVWLSKLAAERHQILSKSSITEKTPPVNVESEKRSNEWIIVRRNHEPKYPVLVAKTHENVSWSGLIEEKETPILGFILGLGNLPHQPIRAQSFSGDVTRDEISFLGYGISIRGAFGGADSDFQIAFHDPEKAAPTSLSDYTQLKALPGTYARAATWSRALEWKGDLLVINPAVIRLTRALTPPQGGAIRLLLPFVLPGSFGRMIDLPENGVVDFSKEIKMLRYPEAVILPEQKQLEEMKKRVMELHAGLKRKEAYLREVRRGDSVGLNQDLSKLHAWSPESAEIEKLNEEIRALAPTISSQKNDSTNHPLMTGKREGTYSIVVQFPKDELILEVVQLPLQQ